MRRTGKILISLAVVIALSLAFSQTAFAISESDVQAQVDAHGREAVSGNVFIWFLCAIAFLKISQKIDSFMSSLGINVGHTGGSMMAEAIIAARGISAGRQVFSGRGFSGSGSRGATGASGRSGASGADGASGFMSGGLAGVVSRQFNKGAVQNATSQSGGGIGGKMFTSSVEKGGDFANNIIGNVAKGSVSATGTITGEQASKALSSYMGHTAQVGQPGTPNFSSEFAADAPQFKDVEIGGGRIMGTEISGDSPGGTQFGMYNTDQYMAPEGAYTTVEAVDGSKWYKQYAADAVEKTPYMAPDGSIAYNEQIVQKLPDVPRRKDRI